MGMELRTTPQSYRLDDQVGALDNFGHPHYGKVDEVDYDPRTERESYWIKESNGDRFGPCNAVDLFFDVTAHVDYPHHPGTLYDCPGCEAIMDKDDNGDYVDPEGPDQHG